LKLTFELLAVVAFILTALDDSEGSIDVMDRVVDVLEDASLEASGFGIVFFLGHIVAGLREQVMSFVQTSGPRHMNINRGMVFDILAIVDGGALYLRNGLIDVVNRGALFRAQGATIRALEMSARIAQIRKRMEISRVLSLRLQITGS
jgi:hypothetical protein